MKQIAAKSLQDILSPSVFFFVAKIALLSLASTLILSWLLWDLLFEMITLYAGWIPWEWLSALVTSLASLLIAYTLFILMVSLFTALMSEKLLITLAKKHYSDTPITGSADIMTSLFVTVKSSAVFLVLFILLLPLIFIPFIGQIVMLYLWSILLKDPTVYDVGALFITDKNKLRVVSKKATLIAMTGSLFNYIPILNLFAPVFAQILFLHHLLKSKK
ncbi:MAG: EI24 domain-containing protein [Sulfurovum sp.]|nr:EI24 domain-containing protein [Sulfurovum sp.]MDD3499608.1 EI24 domain-containing protein [Sulfurovum sp.]